MVLERGFRRLTLTVSLVLLCVGLGLTAYETYIAARYVGAHKRIAHGLRETEAWMPTVEDFKQVPEMWRPTLGPRERAEQLDGTERWKRWTEAARPYRDRGCFPLATGYKLPRHLDQAVDLWITADWVPSWANSMSNESYKLAALPLVWGLLLTVLVAPLPWVVFYFVRWIARGFA